MYTQQDIIEAKLSGDRELLNERSLGRVFQHTKKAGEKSFGIVTSWRSANTSRVNRINMKRLQQMVRSMQLGYFMLKGHWQECQDPNVPYDQCPPNKLVDAVEPSLFVPGLTKAQAMKIARRFEQDAIIYSGPETKGLVTLQFRDGGSMTIGKFSPMKIAQAYSTVKGKDFVFECVAQSHAEALIAGAMSFGDR